MMKGFLLALLSLTAVSSALAEELPGYDRFDIRTQHRSYPVAASIWYPARTRTYKMPIGHNPIFKGTTAYVGAAVAEGKFPLFLFSHGSGGNMDTVSWLSSALAKKGAMVLSVNHPGSTTGDSSPRRSLELEERAHDLSAALDTLYADPYFGPHIDPDKITALGFSLGGATALNLTGLRFDKDQYTQYCEGAQHVDCAFFRKGGVDFTKLPDSFAADMKDPRVTSALVIDPGFTYVATQESLNAMDLPVTIINLGKGEDRFYASDTGPDGSELANRLSNATYHELAPANHFTFLDLCQEKGALILKEEGDDPVCDDPAMTDRQAVHQLIAEIAAKSAGL